MLESTFKINKLYQAVGTLRYSTPNDGYRLVVDIEQDISNYYRSLIPKWLPSQRPKFSAHVTVVRVTKEEPKNLEYWGKYEGEKVDFFYEPYVYSDRLYYWLNIWATRLEEIRAELGLPNVSRYTLPPDGFQKCFHCTIGNKKK